MTDSPSRVIQPATPRDEQRNVTKSSMCRSDGASVEQLPSIEANMVYRKVGVWVGGASNVASI